MAFGLYRKGKGGSLRKIQGNPRSKGNQKNIIVWEPTKKGVKGWIRSYGTHSQKKRHL